MKKTLFISFWLTALILFSIKSYAQQNNTISVVYGTGSDGIFNGSPGAAGFAGKGLTMFGLNYVRRMDGLFP